MTLSLADVRVLAVEQFGAGPWGTLQRADLRAEVSMLAMNLPSWADRVGEGGSVRLRAPSGSGSSSQACPGRNASRGSAG